MITVEREGNRIHLTSPYSPETVDRAKSVSGANWAKSARAWTYPLDLAVCRELRSAFGPKMVVGPLLREWAAWEVANETHLVALASQTEATLSRVGAEAPALASAMASRSYQQVGAAFIARSRRVLLADQPGLGKTLETLAGLIEAGERGAHLVAAPKTAVEIVWAREIPRWLGLAASVHAAVGNRAQRTATISSFREAVAQDPSGLHFLVVNLEMVRSKRFTECPEADANGCDGDRFDCPAKKRHAVWFEQEYPELFDSPWASITTDECDRALIRTSGRPTQARQGFITLPLAENGVKLALSGTPMRGKPRNLWGTLNWLKPEVYTSYWRWIERYFEVDDNGYGKTIGNLRADREAELVRSLAPIMLRRTKGEVLKELPEKQYGGSLLDPTDAHSTIGVWVTQGAVERKQYLGMAESGCARVEGGTVTGLGVLAELTRLKQLANGSGRMSADASFSPALPSAKFDQLVAMLDERGIRKEQPEGGNKIVVAGQFTQVINLWGAELERLGIPVHVLTGETPAGKRAEMVEEFQSDSGPRVMLLNTKAGGVAITLDRADELVFIDETWIPDDQEQTEDRIHRASRMHQVTIYYLRALGTIDEHIARVTGGREAIQKRLLDGSRGVEFARKLFTGEKEAAA